MCRKLLGEGESSCLKADQAHSSGRPNSQASMGEQNCIHQIKENKRTRVRLRSGGSYGRSWRRGCDQNTMNKNSQRS